MLKQKGIPLSVLCSLPAPGLAWAAGRQALLCGVNQEGLSIPINTGMGPSQWVGGLVPSCQMFAERRATCRPSPSICPVLAAAASFLLGPKLFEDIFTHLLLLAKVRGGSRREMTEGRSENALGRSVPGVGPQLLCSPVAPHSPALLPPGRCEDRWTLENGLPKEICGVGYIPP